jgi:cell division protein FtsB
MFLKLFLTLLCSLSLNGLQHKALVIRDAIIIVNTLNQQNLQRKANISYTEAEKNI